MYLRETRRTNRDGSVVSYLQLAHNERHAGTGTPVAKVIHSFGRADTVDRDGLARLVSSISRFLNPEQAVAAAAGVEVEILDSRRMGGSWTLDRLWERLGIGAAIRRVAKRRRLDGEAVERVIFALVAQRALEPGSKLAATGWVSQRVAIEGCAGFTDDQAYRGMDFMLAALDEIASEVFASVAHLLNLDLDIVFVDTTSTYWEVEGADQVADLADTVDDDGVSRPVEQAKRAFGHSKDFRTDLPQVVIAMAVTRDGTPIRCWTFPGNQNDTAIIRTVKDDLAGWNLRRMVWVADRGFASAANRAYLTRGGGHYIHAEKLRHTNTEAAAALARPGRYAAVAGNLRVKEIHVAAGGKGDGDDGARTQRFVVCHNPEQAERDAAVRSNLVAHLGRLIEGSDAWTARKRDELVGSLKTKPGLRRYLRRTKAGLLRIDHGAAKREAHLDGKWLLRTSENGFAGLVGVRADVVGTVRCCHSRIMPDTTAAVMRPGRGHPNAPCSQGRRVPVSPTLSDDPGSSNGHPRLQHRHLGLRQQSTNPAPPKMRSAAGSSGAKIHEDSGAKRLDDTQPRLPRHGQPRPSSDQPDYALLGPTPLRLCRD